MRYKLLIIPFIIILSSSLYWHTKLVNYNETMCNLYECNEIISICKLARITYNCSKYKITFGFDNNNKTIYIDKDKQHNYQWWYSNFCNNNQTLCYYDNENIEDTLTLDNYFVNNIIILVISTVFLVFIIIQELYERKLRRMRGGRIRFV